MNINFEVDWSKLPEWANYVAVDEDGARWCYENKPTKELCRWVANGGRYDIIKVDN